MNCVMRGGKKILCRNSGHRRKWQRKEELALIAFIKRNPDFEKPCARVYYTKFLLMMGIDVDWKLVRGKVRNMRTTYRKAKEYELNNIESSFTNDDIRKQVIKICWFVDDFDMIFPNTMDPFTDKHHDPIYDDEFSKDESLCSIDKSSTSFKINFLPEEESTASSLFKSVTDGDSLVVKKEKPDEDTIIRQKIDYKLNYEQGKLHPGQSRLMERIADSEKTPFRNRTNPIRKWQRNEEIALIEYLKENHDFEHPNARIYYTKFLFENGIDADWHQARNKVRNMRVSYRKAKEHEIKEVDSENCNIQSVRNQILKLCWYLDDFDEIFPNEMDNSACLQIYKNPDHILDDDLSKDEESFDNVDNKNKSENSNLLLEEENSTGSSSNSSDESIFKVHKNLVNLKNQKRSEDINLKQQELELAKEKLNFEKEKFREEIRLREKEIENEEKLKVMEFQMKERIAIKKLEIEEMLALRSAKENDNSYNDIYRNNIR